MSSWDQANRGEKLGLVWRNRKKISQIITDYLYLLFFLLIILWMWTREGRWQLGCTGDGRCEFDSDEREERLTLKHRVKNQKHCICTE
jgi:hypothetical protein